MPRLLEEKERDFAEEALDEIMTPAEKSVGSVRDLTDGGEVGIARVYPVQGGVAVQQGRAIARRAWMWDGTETTLQLAWKPSGKQHDGARYYLRKRHCLCCGDSGFEGNCKRCVKQGCARCNFGNDKSKNIACFYLKIEQVPFPQKLYGAIPCFMPLCIRRDHYGFKSEEEMRQHAASRHRLEYAAHLQTEQAHGQKEIDSLRQQVSILTTSALQTQAERERKSANLVKARANLVKARAARKINRKAE